MTENQPGDFRAELPPRLVLASGNRDKAAALDRALGGLLPVVSMGDVPAPPSSETAPAGDDEEVSTLRANAAAKARRWSSLLPGETIVATDGRLLIPALGLARDPRRTRRFAGQGATNAARTAALLALTQALRGGDRRIGWREALAVAREGAVVAAWEAAGAPGLLAEDVDPGALARAGFWLPALWRCQEFDGRRLDDLSPAEHAARNDHWARLGDEPRRFLTSDVARGR